MNRDTAVCWAEFVNGRTIWQRPHEINVRGMKPQKSRFEISGPTEKFLKNIALVLGVASAVAVVFDAYPPTMFLSFPFCLIWIYCGWLHTEPQLKWINAIFLGICGFGIMRYFGWA
jgi:hypothetical protein